MKKTLFLAFSAAIVIFSIISICCAPIINGVLGESYGWKTLNCKKESDEYKYWKDHSGTDDYLKGQKKVINQCNRHKAMYGLEYSSLILDVVLGFICVILGLLHYFDVAKPFEKITGIIGLATGVIGFVLTLVYICYSGYIFTNENAPDSYDEGLRFSGSTSFPTIDDVFHNATYYASICMEQIGEKVISYVRDQRPCLFILSESLFSCKATKGPARLSTGSSRITVSLFLINSPYSLLRVRCRFCAPWSGSRRGWRSSGQCREAGRRPRSWRSPLRCT